MLWELAKKTGFECADESLRIFTCDGEPFYFHNKQGGRRFNLPAGAYTTENEIKELKEPVKYKISKLRFERNIVGPKTITLYFGDNPNKATIILEKGIILLDNSFKEMPKFVVKYVLLHEFGHYKFKSETGADSFARVEMLKEGYNPSQIMQASQMTLSSSPNRLHECHKELQKNQI